MWDDVAEMTVMKVEGGEIEVITAGSYNMGKYIVLQYCNTINLKCKVKTMGNNANHHSLPNICCKSLESISTFLTN